MDVDRYFEDNYVRGEKPSPENWNSATESDNNPSSNFDCNICLDSVQDPVVTLCGHLYCWPCIYKWLKFQPRSSDEDQKQPRCPVCKAEVSHTTLVPLYGKDTNSNPPSNRRKSHNLELVIPQRPLGLVCGLDRPRQSPRANFSPPQFQQPYPYNSDMYYSSQESGYLNSSSVNLSGTTSNLLDPMLIMMSEMLYAGAYGNSVTNMYSYSNLYNMTSSGTRRHIMQADKSLSRICFFLFCCAMSCLVFF
ncbi:hypothetical protein ACFE04_018718 [Oxalis oulophora]